MFSKSCVSNKFRFQKVAFFIGYVWTGGQNGEKIRFQTDIMRGEDLNVHKLSLRGKSFRRFSARRKVSLLLAASNLEREQKTSRSQRAENSSHVRSSATNEQKYPRKRFPRGLSLTLERRLAMSNQK